MLSEPEPLPSLLPPPVRADARLEIEPDGQWKDDLRKRIEHNLRNKVEDAQVVRDTILKSQTSESSRERALLDYEKRMTAIRRLAQEEFTLQLRLEMSERKWALDVANSNFTQQQRTLKNIQRTQYERIHIVSADASYDTVGALSISPQQQGESEGGSDESSEDRSERLGSAGLDDKGCASFESRESEVEEEGEDPEERGSKPRQLRPPSCCPDPFLTQLLHSKSPVSRRNAPSRQRQNDQLAADNDEVDVDDSYLHPPRRDGSQPYVTGGAPHRPSSGRQAPSWRPHPRPPELSGTSRTFIHANGQIDVARRSSSVTPPTPSGAELPPTHARGRIAMPLRPTTPNELSRVASWGSRIHLGRSLSDFNMHRLHNNTGNSWLPSVHGDYSGESDGVIGRLDDRQSRVNYDPRRLPEAMRQRTAIQRRPTILDEVSRLALWGSRIHLGRSLTHCN